VDPRRDLVPPFLLILKREALASSETMVKTWETRRYHCPENNVYVHHPLVPVVFFASSPTPSLMRVSPARAHTYTRARKEDIEA
jgi:hypothetical protein